MSKPIYIHTLNGKPAAYVKYAYGDYMFYIQSWTRVRASQLFVRSLATIKKQQAAVIADRKQSGYGDEADVYGYIVITNDLENV